MAMTPEQGIAQRREQRERQEKARAVAAARVATTALHQAQRSVDRAERALWKVEGKGEVRMIPVEAAVGDARAACRKAEVAQRQAMGAARKPDGRLAERSAQDGIRAAEIARAAAGLAERHA